MRCVLDTNVVVSGMLWRGAPSLLLTQARAGRIKLFSSPALLAELGQTLSYPKFHTKVAASGMSVDQLVELYAVLAVVVRPDPIEPVILADPDDDAVLACALKAQVDVVVSGDKHLLDLGEWRGIEQVTASSALVRLGLIGSAP